MSDSPSDPATPTALEAARRKEKLSQAEWRRRRAEVARLIAAGEERAAHALLAEAGVEPSAGCETSTTASIETPSAPSANGDRQQPLVRDVSPAEPPREPSRQTAKPRKDSKAVGAEAKGVSALEPMKRPKPSSRQASSAHKQAVALAKQGRAPRVAKRKRRRQNAKVTWAEWLQQRPPWATSLAAHGVIIGLFSLLTFATFGEPGLSLTASMADADAWSEMPTEVMLTDVASDSEESLAEPIETTFDLATEVELASLIEPVDLTAVSAVGDLMAISAESLMAAVPAGGAESGSASDGPPSTGAKPTGGAGRVSFFGAESKADRVVFLVDNSGSMQGGRMETTLFELDNAIRHLSTGQEFYVVFFSDQAYPMFFPEPADAPLQATRENKQRLSKWLHTVEMCLGGRVLDAMEIAVGLEPDVVYLLTDGDIRSEYVAERITAEGAWPFVIHTLGMGARTPQHAAILHAIASNTGGAFRPVAANPAAVTRSRLRPLRYHREPGPVWGSAVKAWK